MVWEVFGIIAWLAIGWLAARTHLKIMLRETRYLEGMDLAVAGFITLMGPLGWSITGITALMLAPSTPERTTARFWGVRIDND